MKFGAVRASVLAAIAALMLGACGPGARDIPDQPPLADQQAIDLCALAPQDQVAAEVSDVVGRGWMRMTLGECWFEVGATPIWLSLAPEELPDSVTEDDPDFPAEQVDGGLIIDTSGANRTCLSRALVSDRGYVIDLAGGLGEEGSCEILDALGTLVLSNLAAGVPTIEWPAGTAGTVDLCSALEELSVAEALGVEEDVVVDSANRFSCQLGSGLGDTTVEFGTRLPDAADIDGGSEIEVAGQSAVSSDGGCTLAIDLGENAALAERIDGGRDVLKVDASEADVDCGALPGALEELVSSLAH